MSAFTSLPLLFSYKLVLFDDWISINALPSLCEKFASTGDFSRRLKENKAGGKKGKK